MKRECAVLAGGCFRGMQDLHRRHDGVISTRVGYTGGDVPNATYRNHGTHAEAIEIIFDPAKVSCRKLLEFLQECRLKQYATRRASNATRASRRHGDAVVYTYRSGIQLKQNIMEKDTIK